MHTTQMWFIVQVKEINDYTFRNGKEDERTAASPIRLRLRIGFERAVREYR